MVGKIQPRAYFPISRVIADPSDATVYYIKAVVRNGRTGATIDTLQLTSLGSGIWAYSWQAPADPYGQGLFITITTIVYTDAGYSSLSDTYGQEQDTFLIYDDFKFVGALAQQISAMGAGPDIDYERIAKIVAKATGKAVDPALKAIAALGELVVAIESPELKPSHLAPVFDALEDLRGALEPLGALQNTDLSEIMALLTSVADRANQIPTEYPEQIPTDLSPVLDAIEKKPVTEIDHEKLAELLKPALGDKLDEALTPEYMDTFLKNGTSSKLLGELMSNITKPEGSSPVKKRVNYKKVGNSYVAS